MKNNVICQKKISGFMRYISALFLVFGMVLLMRMDVNAEIVNMEVNTPYFAEDLVGKGLHFTVPSSGRVRFCFDHCENPKGIRIHDFDDQDQDYYDDPWNYQNESYYYDAFYDDDDYDDYDWGGSIYWKNGLETRISNWFTVNPGDHYARMVETNVNSEAVFTVQYELIENYNGEIESNGTFDSAVEIELNKQYYGSLLPHYNDMNDYYHFVLRIHGMKIQ